MRRKVTKAGLRRWRQVPAGLTVRHFATGAPVARSSRSGHWSSCAPAPDLGPRRSAAARAATGGSPELTEH